MEATVRGDAGQFGSFAACRVQRTTSELSEPAGDEVAALEKTLKQLRLEVAVEESRQEADGALASTILAVGSALSPSQLDAEASRWDAYGGRAALA